VENGWQHRLRDFIIDQKCVPWRLARFSETQLEGNIRQHIPPLYRRIRLGRWRDMLRPLTVGPQHHFFGYFEKTPWNRSGSLLLAHEVSFSNRPPESSDVARIGVIHSNAEAGFDPIAETRAWNWQQGCMLQWHPAKPESVILYNDCRQGAYTAIARDLKHGELQIYQKPIYAVTPDGSAALSVNFARLQQFRPGYGYAGLPDPWNTNNAPQKDGVYLMDLGTGESELLLSLAELASFQPDHSMRDAVHYVNHIQISPEGSHFAFLHCWVLGNNRWGERLCISDLRRGKINIPMPGAMVSHYGWMDEKRFVAWAQLPDIGGHYLVCDIDQGSIQILGRGLLTEDGHCSFSPNHRWLVTDTYPDRNAMRTLILFQPDTNMRINLARLFSPRNMQGEIRCDLHPRWNRDGRQICIDSIHEGSRQMYAIDIEEFVS
jgi:hypothetical protein